jgi:outer membrane protein
MKSTFRLFGAMIIALSSMVSCQQGETTTEPVKTKTEEGGGKTVNTGTMKVGYVNTDSLAAQYELIKDVQDEIVAEQMKMEGEYQSMVQSLQKDYNDAQQGAAGLSQEALAILQQKLAQKEQEVMMQKNRMENQLMQMEQERTANYLDKVQGFIADYAKSNGYDMIYGYNGLNNLLYIDKGYDLTRPIIDELNEQYRSERDTAAAEKDQ